ncbi:hypothetical protein CGCSCA1_v012433 [Colletotrichum siamense]|nr:hypothetical protein CGCSCA1_v012433 [Colletotrichum siamense]
MENRQGVKDGADNVPQQQQGKETKQSWPGKHARNQKLMPSLCLCKEGANNGGNGGWWWCWCCCFAALRASRTPSAFCSWALNLEGKTLGQK